MARNEDEAAPTDVYTFVETTAVRWRGDDGRPYFAVTNTLREASISDDDVLELELATADNGSRTVLEGVAHTRGNAPTGAHTATVSASGDQSSPTFRVSIPKPLRASVGLDADAAGSDRRLDCYAIEDGRRVVFAPSSPRTITLD